MFIRITKWYDFLNHFLSLGCDLYWRHQLVHSIDQIPGQQLRFLDLAAGTLDVCQALQKRFPQGSILALDAAFPMIQTGLNKMQPPNFLGLCADAKVLPIPDESIDYVTIAFGIRNITPREIVYNEVLRILVPGGKLCILEFGSGKQTIWGGLYNLYLDYVLPQFGRLISGDNQAYKYLSDSIKSFPKAQDLQTEILLAGFHRVTFRPLSSGIACLHFATKTPNCALTQKRYIS
jgi:demethylmenaquinone methyltransferase/2-methoxy-6-polyprenyl-1,4-benzoquinol methylase